MPPKRSSTPTPEVVPKRAKISTPKAVASVKVAQVKGKALPKPTPKGKVATPKGKVAATPKAKKVPERKSSRKAKFVPDSASDVSEVTFPEEASQKPLRSYGASA